MPDEDQPTLERIAQEFDELLRRQAKQVATEQAPAVKMTEEDLKQQAGDLAMAVAYTWLTRDSTAQEAFLSEIVNLNPDGLGVVFALDSLTHARLISIKPGMLKPDVDVAPLWAPDPQAASAEDLRYYTDCVQVLTALWSGMASWDHERSAAARSRLAEMSDAQLKTVLLIAAYDVAKLMDTVADWQGAGSFLLEQYREQHPPPSPPQ